MLKAGGEGGEDTEETDDREDRDEDDVDDDRGLLVLPSPDDGSEDPFDKGVLLLICRGGTPGGNLSCRDSASSMAWM